MHIVWVKGHSGHECKDLADHVAVPAGMANGEDRWWTWDFALSSCGQNQYIKLRYTSYSPISTREQSGSKLRRVFDGVAMSGNLSMALSTVPWINWWV